MKRSSSRALACSTMGAMGGFQVNFEGTLVFRGQYQHPLWRSQAQEVSPLGEFWFHLGAAF